VNKAPVEKCEPGNDSNSKETKEVDTKKTSKPKFKLNYVGID
jgi:hypothetical protein